MDRCALFVDAGYLLADGAMAVHGTRNRESVSWDYAGLLQFLGNVARDRTGLPLLRCYWYEATVEGRRTPEHDVLSDLPGVKLRLGRLRPGRREGVESEIHRDLTTLARNNAISDALVVSAEEDLAQVVAEVQDCGLRITLLHLTAHGNWTISRTLRQECDDIVEIGEAHLRPYVELVVGAEPVPDGEPQVAGAYPGRAPANGHGQVGPLGYHQALPVGSHPAPPALYTAPVVADYQRAAQPSPNGGQPGPAPAGVPGVHPAERPSRGAGEPAGYAAASLPLSAPPTVPTPAHGAAPSQRESPAIPPAPGAAPAPGQNGPVGQPSMAPLPQEGMGQPPRHGPVPARHDPLPVRAASPPGPAGSPPGRAAPAVATGRQAGGQHTQAPPAGGHPAADVHTSQAAYHGAPMHAGFAGGQAPDGMPAHAPGGAPRPAGPAYAGPPAGLAPPGPAGGAARPQAEPGLPARVAGQAGPGGVFVPGAPVEYPAGQPYPGGQPGYFDSGPPGQAYVPQQGPHSGPPPATAHAPVAPLAVSLADAVQAAHGEGFTFGQAVARDAPALWLEAVLARKPRMPSDLEARLLQDSALPIDSLLHDEVRHALRRGFWDALERSHH